MIHARTDYNRIQDPDGLIPEGEPVFLIRAKDVVSGDAVRSWADMNDDAGGDPAMSSAARKHAALMDDWPIKKRADAPPASIEQLIQECRVEEQVEQVDTAFWMVLGHGEPTHRHWSEGDAKREACRLAARNPGSTFTILRAVESVWCDVSPEKFRKHDQRPANEIAEERGETPF